MGGLLDLILRACVCRRDRSQNGYERMTESSTLAEPALTSASSTLAKAGALTEGPVSPLERILMATMRRFAGVSREDWTPAEATLVRHRALAPPIVLPMLALCTLVVLFEFSGVFSLLPLMQFVQAEQNLTSLVEKSAQWRIGADVANRLGVPITLVTLALLTVLLMICRQVVFFFNARAVAGARERLGQAIRLSLTRRLFEARPATIRNVGSGSFVVTINQQATSGAAIVSYFLEMVQISLTFAVFAIGIALLSPWIIVLGSACALVIIVCLNTFVRGNYTINAGLARDYDALGQFLAQFYNAWRLVKLTDSIDPLLDELEQRTQRIRDANMSLVKHSGLIQLLAMPMAAVLGLGALIILTGVISMTVAQLTLIIVVLFRLGPMAEALVRLRQSISGAITALARLEKLHVAAVENREVDTGTTDFTPPRRRIAFRNVHFTYPGRDTPALDGVTLELPANQLTAIIGPSGAGKSTLLDLLARIDDPDRGEILIDETAVGAFHLGQLRRGIAVVDQSAVLIDGSIADNLRLARPDATVAQIESALAFASADGFVRAMPDGIMTRVGENGAQLSGGQRQRLTIARAILGDARIVIFDEPTSALDFESETAFRRSMKQLVEARDRTVILVAHRFSTIKDADFVAILRDGRVEEAATPAALTRDASYYRRMIEAQSGDVPDAAAVA